MARYIEQKKTTTNDGNYEPHIWFVCGWRAAATKANEIFFPSSFELFAEADDGMRMMDYSVRGRGGYLA